MIPAALVAGWIALAAPWVSGGTRARYAADIAAAAPSETIAKAMVATAITESDFRPAIERCECKAGECDPDASGIPRAVGLFQLHRYHYRGHSPAEICRSNRLAAELAAHALMGLVARTGGVEEALRVYVGVSVRRGDRRVKRRLDLFALLMTPRLVAEPAEGDPELTGRNELDRRADALEGDAQHEHRWKR